MTYARQQAECEMRFEMVAKESSLRQRDADDARWDGLDGVRQIAATNATVRAQVCAMEYAALEVHKRPAAAGRELTPEAHHVFQELGFKLDEFIQPGEAGLGRRREALALALINPAPGFPGNINFRAPVNYGVMAERVNAGLPAPLHRRVWQVCELAEAAGRVHQALGMEGQTSNPVFNSQQSPGFRAIMANPQGRASEIESLNQQIGNPADWPVLAMVPAIQDARSQMRGAMALEAIEQDQMLVELQAMVDDGGHSSDESEASIDSNVSEQASERRFADRGRARDGRGL